MRITNSYHLKEQVLCLGCWAKSTDVESHRDLVMMQEEVILSSAYGGLGSINNSSKTTQPVVTEPGFQWSLSEPKVPAFSTCPHPGVPAQQACDRFTQQADGWEREKRHMVSSPV